MTFPTASAGIGGGTDFQTKTPAYFAGSLNTNTLTPLVTVNGRGILTSMIVSSGTATSIRVKITIDGVVIADDSAMFTGGTSSTLFYMWGFKKSLLIESSQATASNTNYKATYMLG